MFVFGGSPEQVPMEGRQRQVDDLFVALILLLDSFLASGAHPETHAIQYDVDLLVQGGLMLAL